MKSEYTVEAGAHELIRSRLARAGEPHLAPEYHQKVPGPRRRQLASGLRRIADALDH